MAGDTTWGTWFDALFADYAVDGDVMRCRSCGRRQQVSWRHHNFPHASGCKRTSTNPHPWVKLHDLIQCAPVTP